MELSAGKLGPHNKDFGSCVKMFGKVQKKLFSAVLLENLWVS